MLNSSIPFCRLPIKIVLLTLIFCLTLEIILNAWIHHLDDYIENTEIKLFNRRRRKRREILQQEIDQISITCPSFEDLSTVPTIKSGKCPSLSKYPRFYDSYLYPMWRPYNPGPSEQTQGLKHIIFAAAILGKGLMISNFTTHGSDKLSKSSEVPFGIRVDMEILCQFIEIDNPEPILDDIVMITSKDIRFGQNQCGKDANDTAEIYLYKDDLSNGITYKKNMYRDMHYLEALEYDMFADTKQRDLKAFFRDRNMAYNESKMIGLVTANNWIYGNQVKFIDDGGAYRMKNLQRGDSKAPQIPLREAITKWKMDPQLINDAYLATSHPKFIRDLAKLFVQIYLSNYDFIAIHFRYNPGDFFGNDFLDHKFDCENMTACSGGRGLSGEFHQGIQQSLANTTRFYERVIRHIQISYQQDYPETVEKTRLIYIASPTNTAEIFNKHGKQFIDPISNRKYGIFNTLDLMNFLEKIRPKCWALDFYYGDVLSTIEKEILRLATIFYRSRPSNWSYNVQGHRNARLNGDELQFDRVVFDIFMRR